MKNLVILLALFGIGCAGGADALSSYCKVNTPAMRDVVRDGIRAELVAEGIESCTGCPGDDKTYCTGVPREKIDDPTL